MRPKARVLVQQCVPPGWLKESDPAGCDALTDHTTCPGLGLLSCELLPVPDAAIAGILLNVNIHKTAT
jgi:hypothetical protein